MRRAKFLTRVERAGFISATFAEGVGQRLGEPYFISKFLLRRAARVTAKEKSFCSNSVFEADCEEYHLF